MCPCNTYFNKLHYCKLNKTLMLIFKNLKKDVFCRKKFNKNKVFAGYYNLHVHTQVYRRNESSFLVNQTLT